jgi:5-formyltetrahydrofolate cyclo-ligase
MTPKETTAVRSSLKRKRRSLDPDFVADASEKIGARFWRSSFAQRATNIAIYMSTAGEVDCSTIIETAWLRKKRVFAPVLQGKRLEFASLEPDTKLAANRFGILEPVYARSSLLPRAQLDIVVIPLLAFDAKLNRLGMGAGFYDRSFAFTQQQKQWRHPILVGAAYSFQQIKDTHPKPWDVPLHVVITEKECFGSY